MTKLINTPIGKKFPEKKEILNEITMHDLDYDYEIGFNQCLEIVSNIEVAEKKIDFEDFLAEKHAEQYTGTKHCMVDDCADWIENLSPDEFIEYGNLYIKKSLEA